ncbi:MAG: ATP-binding protein [Gemmatimonadales bacterium]
MIPPNPVPRKDLAERAAAAVTDTVASRIDGQVGDGFFRTLALALGPALGVRGVAVGEIRGPDRDRITTVAFAVDGALIPPLSYSALCAPCGDVAIGSPLVVPDRTRLLFPACPVLEVFDAIGYVGVPVFGGDVSPIGLLIVLHDQPLHGGETIQRTLEALAPRTGAELERRRIDEERASLQAQLVEAQKMEALGTLAGGIAHDFNNILMGILGNAEMAHDDLEPWHPAANHLAEIRRAAHRARDLVQRILTFGRKREPVRRAVSMKTVVDELVLLLRASLPSTIELVVEHGDEPVVVDADASQVHQVLMNLASNAAHAIGHRPGRIVIRDHVVDTARHSVRTQPALPEGHYVQVSVSDTGVGMDRETLGRVFEPFFTTKAPGEGTGLGLAVAHGIMREHHGAITASSAPDEGARFDLYFPLHEQPATADPAVGALPLGSGQHVLVVDDESSIVRVTSRMLERLGYRVSAFESAPRAIEALVTSPDDYHLVLSDLTMPELTGFDLAERIRQVRPGIPILLTSGHPELTEDPRLALVDEVLTKPYPTSALALAVHRLVFPEATAPAGA